MKILRGSSRLKMQILLWVLGLQPEQLYDLHSPWPSLYRWNMAALAGFAWKFERFEDQIYKFGQARIQCPDKYCSKNMCT